MRADELIAAGRKRLREVALDEGVTVHVRLIPGDQLERAVAIADIPDAQAALAAAAVLFAATEEGAPLFQDEVEAAQLPSAWLRAITEAGLEFNGLTEDAARALEGNSPGAAPAGSGSSSPKSSG